MIADGVPHRRDREINDERVAEVYRSVEVLECLRKLTRLSVNRGEPCVRGALRPGNGGPVEQIANDRLSPIAGADGLSERPRAALCFCGEGVDVALAPV